MIPLLSSINQGWKGYPPPNSSCVTFLRGLYINWMGSSLTLRHKFCPICPLQGCTLAAMIIIILKIYFFRADWQILLKFSFCSSNYSSFNVGGEFPFRAGELIAVLSLCIYCAVTSISLTMDILYCKALFYAWMCKARRVLCNQARQNKQIWYPWCDRPFDMVSGVGLP